MPSDPLLIDNRTPNGDWKRVGIRRLIRVSLCPCYIRKLLAQRKNGRYDDIDELRVVQSSVVVERIGDFSIATDRNAAARQFASIILSVFTLQLK